MPKAILGNRKRKKMNIIDLEYFRWKMFKTLYLSKNSTMGLKYKMDLPRYWKEHGSFASILPRQTGKTHMLGNMAVEMINDGGKVMIVCVNKHVSSAFTNMLKKSSCIVSPSIVEILLTTGSGVADIRYKMSGIKPEEYNLVIDEFLYIRPDKIDELFSYAWETVTMASSM